ncbi:hypothetical protein Pyn_05838 [Prunus yedoensis var. nudiflora]|uniref:Uncharacterized protein n=1 Tax=Prunus yedoensis var. nudiflora TaxID=2094558 RepID=A0A314YWV8_PRUYE|nr:hypothetical protein Pyn_05838 [Prunus yedoensis var. nudiflora]
MDLMSVLKMVVDSGKPYVAETVGMYETIENDLGNVVKELDSLGFCASFPKATLTIEGRSHITTSGSPPPMPVAAVSYTTASPTPPIVGDRQRIQ